MSAPEPNGSEPGAAITFRDVTVGYGRTPVLQDVDGAVGVGALLAVVGPNGAGKSTLLKGIVREAPVLAGAIDLHGRARGNLAYLPQQAEVDRAFPIGVFDFVATGAWRRLGPFRRAGPDVLDRVTTALRRVGLSGAARLPIGELSGGQMQRALFARTIVQESDLILLDEPFAAIDERTTDELLQVVCGWHSEGRTVVAALHDHDQVRTAFPTALLLARTPVAWGPTAAVLAPANLSRARQVSRAWSDAPLSAPS